MRTSQRRNLMGFPLAILVWIAAIVHARGDTLQQRCQDKHAVDKFLLERGVLGSNGKPSFKIALFADLHYGENAWEAWGPAQDANSSAVMSKLLDQELPGTFLSVCFSLSLSHILIFGQLSCCHDLWTGIYSYEADDAARSSSSLSLSINLWSQYSNISGCSAHVLTSGAARFFTIVST